MGIDKQGSKGGNYVGGFLQMFDWNAKSRKKLFSSKLDVPEESKQKKRCDGNLPVTRLNLLDADENAAGSSVKGNSDYSCSSSLINEDFCGPKVPGVVARLMGLDSLPKSSIPESYSTPLFEPHSLSDSYYRSKKLEYSLDQSFQTSQKVINRPIKKFQTEILPPRLAKSIPITHHKLLSPIKSGNFVPSKNAAQIMEAAARIIDPGPQERLKKKPPTVGSSSVPLRVHDLKEKVQASQKVSKILEGSQRKSVKNLKGPVDTKPIRVLQDSEESSKNKGKSISLALQAKANVQKRESLNAGSNRNVVGRKEPSELSPSHTRKSMIKKTSVQNGLNALRQNNQKQNCIVDRGKLPPRKGGKMVNGESSCSSSSSSRQRNSRKLTSDNKMESERVTSKKRSVDGNYHMVKNQAAVKMETKNIGKANDSFFQDNGRSGTDVVSFTFTAPMTRSGSSSGVPAEGETSAPRFSYIGHNVKGGDALSILLEQKLKELARKVEFSQQKSGMHSPGMGPTSSWSMVEDNQGVLEETSTSGSTTSQPRKLLDHRLPSPVSVLEHSPSAESCNSSDSAESTGSKQCSSSMQAQEVLDPYSSNTFLGTERDADLSDSASSISAKRHQTATLIFTNSKNPQRWEVEYVKKMLHNIEPMFKDYALGISSKIISPLLFDQLQRHKDEAFRQRILFDCVEECLDLKCRQYVNGGYTLWVKGSSTVRRKERLAEEIYREVTGWSLNIGEDMIDGLVDKDMSCQHGRWVDFDVESFEIGTQIESKILSSLIDEVVADILQVLPSLLDMELTYYSSL